MRLLNNNVVFFIFAIITWQDYNGEKLNPFFVPNKLDLSNTLLLVGKRQINPVRQ